MMKLLSILTNSVVLFLLHQAVSLWFLSDFFLARDSATVDSLWKKDTVHASLYKNISLLSETAIGKHCGDEPYKEPHFDKIVLIVIDALASNFIPSIDSVHHGSNQQKKRMPFLETLLASQRGMGFVARAATPTVTMPRIKALLSGTIPSFIDVAYNLASDVRHFDDDNILRIAKAKNKSIVFYGDDTWLSLFERDMFTRSKETFSFFASDYTTVDTNVTQSALPETRKDLIDWDYLILHYLGLDHIGHVFGSNTHPLINEKLLDMDSVIHDIHSDMSKKKHRTLIVVCGDHGMSREGNHGGDTDLEANTAMIFLPINQQLNRGHSRPISQTINQIDFPATISILTNSDIPRMSRGVVIKPLLESLWTNGSSKVTCALLNNVIQLSQIDRANPKICDSLTKLLLRHIEAKDDSPEFAEGYYDIAKSIQSDLIKAIASRNSPILIIIAIIFVILLSLLRLHKTSLSLLIPMTGKRERIIGLVSFAVPIIAQGSTDFIEFEHILWPIFSIISLLMLVLLIKRSSISRIDDNVRVVSFFITFVITTMCQDLHLLRGSKIIPTLSLIIMCDFLRKSSSLGKRLSLLSSIVIFVVLATCKYIEEQSESYDSQDNTIDRAVVQRISIALTTFYTVWNFLQSRRTTKETDSSQLIQKLASGWMLTALLLARPSNFLFLVANVLMEANLNSVLDKLELGAASKTLVYVNFAQSAFYSQGNTNLFSSIDVRPAFFGQTSYSISLSVPLVAISTYSTQIYWIIKLLQRVQGLNDGVRDLINVRNFLSFSYFMCICMILRNHLFVWSVLSPKLVYHYVSNTIVLLTISVISNIHRLGYKSNDYQKTKVIIA